MIPVRGGDWLYKLSVRRLRDGFCYKFSESVGEVGYMFRNGCVVTLRIGAVHCLSDCVIVATTLRCFSKSKRSSRVC